MVTTPSERRMVENEKVFRRLNEQVQQGFDQTNALAIEEHQPEYVITLKASDPPLHFYCECSNIKCTDRIRIAPYTYNKIHKRRDHFVVVPGHEVLAIERIVRTTPKFNVIEKLILNS
jgi:hypothetical protein